MGQIFSVIFGMDLIKKPVTAVIGGTKKIFQGAYEVQHLWMVHFYVLHVIWIKEQEMYAMVISSNGNGLGASM